LAVETHFTLAPHPLAPSPIWRRGKQYVYLLISGKHSLSILERAGVRVTLKEEEKIRMN